MDAQGAVRLPPVRELVASFDARLREMEPSISRETPRYRAALLLLSLTSLPAQIDHLSHWLSIPREFVARCLRRLVDNGVLAQEGLVGGWTGDVMVEEAFWADVNVANGTWLRRHDSRGSLEWIEAGGGWQKPYDYVMNEAAESPTKYIPAEGSRPQLNLDCFTFWPQLSESTWIGSNPPGEGQAAEASSPFLIGSEAEATSETFAGVEVAAAGANSTDLALATAGVVWLA